MSNVLVQPHFQSTPCTYLIHIQFQYSDRHAESLSKENSTAFLVEELVGQLLLTLFDGVFIDEVHITPAIQEMVEEEIYRLRLNARCPHHAFPTNTEEVKELEYTLEHKLGVAFLELFDSVEIDQIEVRFIPTERE